MCGGQSVAGAFLARFSESTLKTLYKEKPRVRFLCIDTTSTPEAPNAKLNDFNFYPEVKRICNEAQGDALGLDAHFSGSVGEIM